MKTNKKSYVLIICIIIALMYTSSISTIYLFSDEVSKYGINKNDILGYTIRFGFVHGRPFAGLGFGLIREALSFGEAGLIIVRCVQMIASIVAAIFSFFILCRIGFSLLAASLIVIFVWAQPAIAIYHAYSVLLPYWIGVYCALISFWIFLNRENSDFDIKEGLLHGSLFLVGFLTFQMTPFFALGFLSVYILTNPDQIRRQVLLLLTLVCVTVIYVVGFRLGTILFGMGTAGKAVELFGSNPISLLKNADFLAVFEFWNYPFPIARLQEKSVYLVIAAGIWLIVVISAARKQCSIDRQQNIRWLLVGACIALSWLPDLVDGSDRQHMQPPILLTLVLLFCFAVKIIQTEKTQNYFMPLALVIVVYVCIGANLQYSRSIVNRYAEIFSFVQQSAISQPGNEETAVYVVVPQKSTRCAEEPCTAYFGRLFPYGKIGKNGIYHTALSYAGIARKLPPIFVEHADEIPEGATVIDWHVYIALLKSRENPLTQKLQKSSDK